MARTYFKWIVVFEDGSTETVEAQTANDVIDEVENDWETIHSIIKLDLWG